MVVIEAGTSRVLLGSSHNGLDSRPANLSGSTATEDATPLSLDEIVLFELSRCSPGLFQTTALSATETALSDGAVLSLCVLAMPIKCTAMYTP